jgi:hypothetical protein
MSAVKQTGVSQQNSSGTAAFAPQQKSGCTGAIEPCWPRHAKRSLARLGASMYGLWPLPKAAGRNQLSCHFYHCGECSETRGSNPDYGTHRVRGGRMHPGEWAHE